MGGAAPTHIFFKKKLGVSFFGGEIVVGGWRKKDVESIGLIIIGPRFPSFFLFLEKGIPIFEKKRGWGEEKRQGREKPKNWVFLGTTIFEIF